MSFGVEACTSVLDSDQKHIFFKFLSRVSHQGYDYASSTSVRGESVAKQLRLKFRPSAQVEGSHISDLVLDSASVIEIARLLPNVHQDYLNLCFGNFVNRRYLEIEEDWQRYHMILCFHECQKPVDGASLTSLCSP